ncbi:hypothetical protein Tsubulata_042332 [Turnera subulata]|uniref:Uncharacterized protein n=1 Tax=Turnera subulata TaxID=218843 RepID=A0A9Q0G3X6_9ROSI|nr:hypothetical protein Tsubulata_042332 [Turnera subulata]
METVAQTSAAAYPTRLRHTHIIGNGTKFSAKDTRLFLPNSYFPSSPSPTTPFTSLRLRRTSVLVCGKKNSADKNPNKKPNSHPFYPREDEATGPFPEAVLLKKEKLQEDGTFRPDFADEKEEKLYEYLTLEMQSKMKVDRMRHYEVVYLIHEKYEEEVRSVNDKVQDFVREKKGRIWRFNDWGMRQLAYEIEKAENAHYILMNFEMEAQWINDFKSLLDKDERVIRHLVIKMDKAVTEDCPPPPEFGSFSEDMVDDDEDYDSDYEDDEDWEEEDDVEGDEDEMEEEYEDGDLEEEYEDDEMDDDIIIINGDDDSYEDEDSKSADAGSKRRNQILEKVGRQ